MKSEEEIRTKLEWLKKMKEATDNFPPTTPTWGEIEVLKWVLGEE